MPKLQTMNSGLIVRNEKISPLSRELIDEAVAAGKIQYLQPAGVNGSEVSRDTRTRIAAARRAWRKKNKEKHAAAKADSE